MILIGRFFKEIMAHVRMCNELIKYRVVLLNFLIDREGGRIQMEIINAGNNDR
jgi:hypothetical protein